MKQLYSQRPDEVCAPVFRGAPLQFAGEEWVYPPRMVRILPREVTTIEDRDCDSILERYARSGIVEVHQGKLEDAKRKAKRARYDFLVSQLTNYQNFVRAQQAAGAPFQMPRQELYEFNDEMQALKAEITANDPVLSAVLPTVREKPMPELMGEELAKLGIQADPGKGPVADLGL